MWNEPKQERSRKRFTHILDTAAALFAHHGYDAVTTNHIAEQAQVAIGSLYQFFPNKEAVLAALIARYIDEMRLIFPLADISVPFKDYISMMIDRLAVFESTHAGFRHVFTDMHEPTTRMHGVISERVEGALAVYFPQMSSEQLKTCASVGIGIVKGLMILAEPPYALPVEVMLKETKAAVVAYIDGFLQREKLV